jgi:MFS family permease
LGLGFTFFSGATEAWLVDALKAAEFDGNLESVFGKAQTVGGAAMLAGSVAGGLIAQVTNLGVPYILRAALLGVTLLVAFRFMHDQGFAPKRGAGAIAEVRSVLRGSIEGGWRNPPVRWMMLAAPFTMGSGIYAFYALQPHLLNLYGDQTAYWIAGLAAAIVAGAQILGGVLVSQVRRLFSRRTDALAFGTASTVVLLLLIGWTNNFWVAIVAVVGWALIFSASGPLRQAYVNGCIPSDQRATVLSFDALMGSAGGVVAQPALGRVADLSGYGTSYLFVGAIQAVALPFVLAARRAKSASDPIVDAVTAT